MDRLLQDVRYAVRALWRTPGFTTVALLTLALGIGANTAIFSIVNGVILRPLGYPKPEQLMYITSFFGGPLAEFWVSPPEYMEFREINRSFAAVGAYATTEVNLTAGDRPLRVRAAAVDDHLLRALAIAPAQGRLFAPGEADVRGPNPVPPQPPLLPAAVVVLSHELWQRAFGGRPMVGDTIEIDGRRREVIGIMPPGADVMDNRTEVWVPLGLNQTNRQNRANHYLYLVGRLKDGVTQAAAEAELRTLVANWGDRVGVKPGPGTHLFQMNAQGGHALQMEPMQQQILGTAGRSIWVLQAAVGFVLLIACANLANLLLARAESRHREFAVRSAIGATRARLLRQFVTEGLVLSVAGAALGVWLARAGVRLLIAAYPATLPRTSDVSVDTPVLLFAAGVAIATGVLFGLAPILHTRVQALAAALKDSGAKGATSAARHHVRHGLVMGEIALAVMLVVGAGLLARTVFNLASVDAGFDRGRLVTFSITLPRATYPRPTDRVQMFDRLLGTLRAVPGVQAASAMTGLPPRRDVIANTTQISNTQVNNSTGGDSAMDDIDYYQNVTSDYFETMGIPIVQGRGFQRSDLASPEMVTIVNETAANKYWKGQNPIGQRMRQCCGDQVPWRTVIGVARDVKQGGVDQITGTEMYFYVDEAVSVVPPRGNVPETMNVVLRTTLRPAALTQTIERAVKDADPAVPVVRLREMDDVFDEAIQRPRLLAQLIGGFAGLALLLAGIGTYGVLSYMVAERRREIGIRMALGAERLGVLSQILRHGFTVTAAGLVVGVAGALVVSRLVRSLLFGVQPTDIATIGGVVTTIAVVAAVACGLPAWRASRLDPNVVLRED